MINRNALAVEIIAGINTKIYGTAIEAFNEMKLPDHERRELIQKIMVWNEEYSDYIEKKYGTGS